jgi:hypothetical protein
MEIMAAAHHGNVINVGVGVGVGAADDAGGNGFG